MLYDRGELLTLYDCQIRPLREAFRRNQDGSYVYNTILWSWPKKSAKSTVVAAVADLVAATRPHSSVKLVANDLKQADSRVGLYLREGLRANKERLPTVRIKNYQIEYLNRSRIEMVPIDPNGEAGGNDDLIVYSELWGWKSPAHIKMWDEMTLSPTKYGNSQRWIDTYAGMKGESPILENLYKLGIPPNARQIWPDLEVYANDEARLLCVWVTRPMLPWQLSADGQAYYAEQRRTITPDGYRRMHGNEWVSSTAQFVPDAWLEKCQHPVDPMRPKQELILALDAGVTSDTFGMVAVTRRFDKAQERELTTVRYARKWTPPPGGKLDFAEPEKELVRLCMTYNVSRVVYDPYQLHDMMTRFGRRLIADVAEFPQAGRRYEADKHLYDLIREEALEFDPRVPGMTDLAEHIGNANREEVGEKMHLIKRTPDDKIDLCVALSMAAHEAKAMNLT